MRPLEWMKTMLHHRDLERPDGRPLYQYRITDDEYAELIDILRLSASMGVTNIYRMLSWDAAFVIYSAEWWRRSYDGHWGWEDIFGSIGIDYAELSTGRRNELIDSGLHRWRREVRAGDGARKFLGTVATEGGLPLHQLSDSGGWLKNVLKPVLRKSVSRGIDISLLIYSYEDFIPRSYRSPETTQILADIATIVIDLRHDHQLMDKELPLQWLDANQPNWRESFPLPIDDDSAKALLGDLVAAASELRGSESIGSVFELERLLNRLESPYPELVARIETPRFVYFDRLRVARERETFPSVVDIEVYEPRGSVWPWCGGIATTYRGKQAYKLSGKTFTLKGLDATKELKVRIRSMGETIFEQELTNEESLDDKMPWLFRSVDGKWLLHGTASQSIKDDEAVVFVPDDCSTEAQAEGEVLTEYGRLDSGKLLKISGDIVCRIDDAKYILSAGNEESVISYQLVGGRFPYRSLPAEVYIGAPTLKETNSITGRSARKKTDRLLAKPIGVDAKWHPIDQVNPGVYEVRMMDDKGNVLLRRRIGILSEDFCFKVCPSKSQVSTGCISLSGIEAFTLNVPGESVTTTVESRDSEIDIQLRAVNLPPMNVDVSLLAPQHHRDFLLSFPFPSKGALLFDPGGLQIPFSTRLYINDLNGYRIRLYDDKLHGDQRVELQLSLIRSTVSQRDSKDMHIRRKLAFQGLLSEYSIGDWRRSIASLISVGASLDSAVQVSMLFHGKELFRLSVFSYEFQMAPQWETGVVELDANAVQGFSVEVLKNIHVGTLPVTQPEQNTVELVPQSSEGVLTGNWDFRPEKRGEGSWMIYPLKSSTIKFRPLLWNVGEQVENMATNFDESITLSKAMQVPDQFTRDEAIRHVLKVMSNDLSHKSWLYLSNLWNKTSHLPITTFDVWNLSIGEPEFLACLFVKDSEGIIEKLVNELPLLWELVGVRDWENAFHLYKQNISLNLKDDPELVFDLVAKKISKVASLGPSMMSISKILRLRILGEEAPELQAMDLSASMFLQPQLKLEFQNLLRRQSDNDWPEFLREPIQDRHRELPETCRSLITIYLSHQLPVVYLPWVLAKRALSEDKDKWPTSPEDLFKISQLIQFDEDWFSVSFQLISGWLSRPKNRELI